MHNLPLEKIIEWDIPNWSQALIFWQSVLPANPDQKILLLGERNGGLTLWLTLQGYNVISSDYDGITPDGIAMHQHYKVTHLIDYRKINIFEIPFVDNYFDFVVCKSVIGGLKLEKCNRNTRTREAQYMAIKEVNRVLKKGGYFLGAENMKGSWMHSWLRKITKRNLGWRYLTRDDLNYFFNTFEELNVKYYGFFGTLFKGSRIKKTIGILDRAIDKVLPSGTKYISFIIAKK